MRSAAFALALAAAAAAQAQGLVDPTKPPPAWMPPDPKAVSQKAEGAADEAGAVPVQILLVGKTRRFALVRGDLVGDKTAGAKIIDIKRNDVIVQTDRGRETLNLFPDVQKTPPKKPAGLGKKEQK